MGKIDKKPRHCLVWIIFFTVLAAHVFFAQKWISVHFIHGYQYSWAFLNALSMAYQDVVNAKYSFFDFLVYSQPKMLGVGSYWPSVVPMVGLWTLLLLPLKWFFLQNIFFLAMIMLGIYYVTRRIIGNDFCGMLSAIIFSCYWAVCLELISFEAQLATTACIIWAFYFYIRSRSFTIFWAGGLVGGLTLLALYCDRLAPAVFLLPLFFMPENFRSKKSFVCVLMVLAFVIVGACPFYSGWIRMAFTHFPLFLSHPNDVVAETASPLDTYRMVLQKPYFLFVHAIYYLISLPERLLGYGFSVLLLLGTILVVRIKKFEMKVVWSALIFPLFVFTLIIKKSFPYIFPLCIYFAMITGMGIHLIRTPLMRYLSISLIVVISGIQVLFFIGNAEPPVPLFSNYFQSMRDGRVPRLFLGDYPLRRKGIAKPAFSIVNELRSVIASQPSFASASEHDVLVGFQDGELKSCVIFLGNIFFPKINFINDPIVTPNSPQWCRIDKPQIEGGKISWSDVVEKLTKNGWAEAITPGELRLKPSWYIEKDKMAEVFGNDFALILPVLQHANWGCNHDSLYLLTDLEDERALGTHAERRMGECSWSSAEIIYRFQYRFRNRDIILYQLR